MKNKKAQTNTLKLALLIGGIFIFLVIIYNVLNSIAIKGKTPDSWSQGGELATVKTSSEMNECSSNENCDDKNDCTDDFCKNKICEYTNKTEGISCSIGESGGTCKNGKCVSV